MNIFLTFDYELFFGSNTGTVQKCMIQPTNDLLALAEKYQTPMTFFVDVGFLLALEKFKVEFPILLADYDAIIQQIEKILKSGSDVQLHIHPHWEKSVFDGDKWLIQTAACYKISDFSKEEADEIITRYKNKLDEISGKISHTFRAGGWCIQPFDYFEKSFEKLNIKYDTSVFPKGHFDAGEYAFDFRNAPEENPYKFQSDVCIEDKNGFFTEYAIGSYRYSPLFYWRLYILGRLNPKAHKMIGDGIFMSQPGRKKQVLTNYTWNHVSTDGYYASKLSSITQTAIDEGKTDLVIIGHPKGNTQYSLRKLESFLSEFNKKCVFKTFSSLP